jgi:hypothetical protein
MQALAVVEAGDVIGHVKLGFCMVRVIALPDTLHLQVQEETFSDSVDAPMSRNLCYRGEIRHDQRIKFPHNVALQATMNFLV